MLGGRLGEETRHFRVEGEVLRYHEHAFPLRAGTEELPLPALLDAQWYRLGLVAAGPHRAQLPALLHAFRS